MVQPFHLVSASILLAASAAAQQQMPPGSLQPVSAIRYGHYDFQGGFAVSPGGGQRATGPDVLFDTISLGAYYYGVIGSGTSNKQEWLDTVELPDRGSVTHLEEVNGMEWIYCEGGYVSYFNAVLSIYDNTTPCVGPTQWIPGVPSFADCLYGLLGLPGSGCWQVSVDLSGGAECVVPDIAGGVPIGWSVTPYINSPFYGPLLTQQPGPPGNADVFEWRDWTGEYFGVPYTHGGCFTFSTATVIRDFAVRIYGSPLDVRGTYGSGTLDTLVLQAGTNPEPGGSLAMQVEGADTAARTYVQVISAGPPANAAMSNGFGTWTRQVSTTPALTVVFGATGPVFSRTQAIPAGAPPDARAQVQIVEMTGPVGLSGVSQATNGLDFRL